MKDRRNKFSGEFKTKVALEAIKGHDIGWIARNPGDSASDYEIFSRWLRAQAKASSAK